MNIQVSGRVLPPLRQFRSALLRLRLRLAAYAWEVRSSRARRRLNSVDPDVFMISVGYFRLSSRMVDRYSAADAAADDLELVMGLLEEAAIPYFLVPGESRLRHTVGVEETYRNTILKLAGQRFGNTAVYVGAVSEAGSVASAALWADGKLPKAVRQADVIRMGNVRLGPERQALGDVESGCEVEFWRRGEDVDPAVERSGAWLTVPGRQLGDAFVDALVAPRRNRVSEVVPIEAQKPTAVTVRRRRVRTFEPFAEPGIGDVAFPIDAVYTWVDGNNPIIAAKRQAYSNDAAFTIADREVGPSRYTSHDELKYSLRSLEMYAGFIRHIYIVTDGQLPDWLNPEAEGVTVVDHRDIFPDSALPVFNSHAIESRLHHIAGLPEHYLYFNDDVFINRPVRAEHFFHGNGIARIPLSPLKLGLGDPNSLEPAPNSAGKNVRKVILRHCGRHITNKILHTPHPQLLSVMKELAGMGFEELENTSYSRFRSTEDIAPISAHHHWAVLSGRAVPGEYRFRYVDVGRPDMRERLERITGGEDIDFFCLNDVDTSEADLDVVRESIHSFLERKFPFPSRAER
jgi:hypothetical protein